jgi:hypothetical protein
MISGIRHQQELPIADLLGKNSVFFDEEVDGIPLALIYPTGDVVANSNLARFPADFLGAEFFD